MKTAIRISAVLVFLSLFTTSIFGQEEIKNTNEVKTKAQVKTMTAQGTNVQNENWVDADGDGVCDNVGTQNQGQGKGYGKKDGTGNPAKPQDGTGFGKMNGAGNGSGNGAGDGTGSSGSQKRSGKNK